MNTKLTSEIRLRTLDDKGISEFLGLLHDAATSTSIRFFPLSEPGAKDSKASLRQATCEDCKYHLEFLRPVVEFGILQPMIDYLKWLESVLNARLLNSQQEIAQSLDWLSEYFQEHMSADNGKIVADALAQARDGFLATTEIRQPSQEQDLIWEEAAAFEQALLAGDQQAALAIVNDCLDRKHKLTEVEMYVIQPALYSIGDKWQSNLISVAQEHLATSITEFVMSVALLRAPPPKSNGKKALLTCAEGNHHAVGLLMVSHALILDGWDVQYLGANVPTTSVVQQVEEWKPNLLAISLSFPQQLPVIKKIISQLTERYGKSRPAFLLGGLAINHFNELANMAGADAFGANAMEAIESATKLSM